MRLQDAVAKYIKDDPARFHAPGHKGRLPMDGAFDVSRLPHAYGERAAIRASDTARDFSPLFQLAW